MKDFKFKPSDFQLSWCEDAHSALQLNDSDAKVMADYCNAKVKESGIFQALKKAEELLVWFRKCFSTNTEVDEWLAYYGSKK